MFLFAGKHYPGSKSRNYDLGPLQNLATYFAALNTHFIFLCLAKMFTKLGNFKRFKILKQ